MRLFFQLLSPPGDQWCDVLGFVPEGSVSSQAPQHFKLTRRKPLLMVSPVYLPGHFLSLWHVQGSTSTGVFDGGCRTLTHASLGFAFHFSLFVASSLNLRRMACVVRLSPHEANPRRACVTASTSGPFILEAETIIYTEVALSSWQTLVARGAREETVLKGV